MKTTPGGVLAFTAVALTASLLPGTVSAAPVFYATSSPTNWSVSTNVSNADVNATNTQALPSQFLLAATAFSTAVLREPLTSLSWIGNTVSGSNLTTPILFGNIRWTQFVFRQTFDLTGYDPATAVLRFQWAADDSGNGVGSGGWQGSWIPQFRLNGASTRTYYPGASPTSPIPTYDLSPEVTVNSGFIGGLNTIEFFVQGNGWFDGMALQNVSFTANSTTAIPVPAPVLLLGTGLLGLLGIARRRK